MKKLTIDQRDEIVKNIVNLIRPVLDLGYMRDIMGWLKENTEQEGSCEHHTWLRCPNGDAVCANCGFTFEEGK